MSGKTAWCWLVVTVAACGDDAVTPTVADDAGDSADAVDAAGDLAVAALDLAAPATPADLAQPPPPPLVDLASPPPPPPPDMAGVCVPAARDTAAGGGRCADLEQAWTARGINVGYYPYRVLAPLPQYSGDYGGAPGVEYQPGGAVRGVLLQTIPAGAYVGLSSTGPWYDPPTGCFPAGQACGAPARAACSDDSPPLRPQRAGFAWGYAYAGASHVQGWIPVDGRVAFAGFDAAHPCALGPAGADFEVATACGRRTACAGGSPTCGATNHCDEGSDDCGACGAASGGALTPTAHRGTLHRPGGAVACTTRTPPHAGVLCLPNGAAKDFFFVYPFGAYLYWAQNSTTRAWLHYGDRVQSYFHNRDSQGVLWDFVEVLDSGAPTLTPPSDGAGDGNGCSANNPSRCTPCRNGGTCGWIQDVFLEL